MSSIKTSSKITVTRTVYGTVIHPSMVSGGAWYITAEICTEEHAAYNEAVCP